MEARGELATKKSSLRTNRLALAIGVSVGFNLFLVALASLASIVFGDDSVLVRITGAFVWPAAAVVRLVVPPTHDLAYFATAGIVGIVFSIALYSCIAWALLAAAHRYRSRPGRLSGRNES